MQVVPFTSDYDQSFSTQLGADRYLFDCRWNERAQFWTFDLTRDADQVLLLAGAPLLSGQDVLSPYALGIGGLVVADLSNAQTDPGPDDLGDRVIVAFFSPAELAILAGAAVPGIVAPGAVPGTPAPPTPGGGGSSGGTGGTVPGTTTVNTTVNNLTLIGGGFGSDEVRSSDSSDGGNEVLAYYWPVNVALNPNPTLKAIATIAALGTGTIRIYVGGGFQDIGTVGTPSGTLVGSVAGPGALGGVFINGTPVTNPGGIIPVKVTIQTSSSLAIDVINGALA